MVIQAGNPGGKLGPDMLAVPCVIGYFGLLQVMLCIASIDLLVPFHAGDRGSNPLGDAICWPRFIAGAFLRTSPCPSGPKTHQGQVPSRSYPYPRSCLSLRRRRTCWIGQSHAGEARTSAHHTSRTACSWLSCSANTWTRRTRVEQQYLA